MRVRILFSIWRKQRIYLVNKITVVGSGTAGLVASLMLKKAFPLKKITIVSSSKIGIIGVGEGSTEHWNLFIQACDIPLAEMIPRTRATHKVGIRFENWTNHTPDYFHSVASVDTVPPFNVYAMYNHLIKDGKTLSENTLSRGVLDNTVRVADPHRSVNQYHFDTNALNKYLTDVCIYRGIEFIDDEVLDVLTESENGNISSIKLSSGQIVESDFWLDATGEKRFLMSKISSAEWNSFSDYLFMDSAIPFPTEADPSGQIRPYTRARSMKNGWVWEIPTQDRRGNGYVYSSAHCSDDQAIKEVSELMGFEVNPFKLIKFTPGYLKKMWVKNCVAVGLASAFVEPLEATSIGGTIQQIRCLVENISTYVPSHTKVQEHFNQKMSKMMENILAMISLHYISDREDSQMWIDIKNTKKPEYLTNLLELWNERPPFQWDIPSQNFEMFHVPHFYHVAQGQKLINPKMSELMLKNFNIEEQAKFSAYEAKLRQSDHERMDHAQALKLLEI